MEWVEGKQFNKHVDELVRTGDRAALAILTQQWQQLARDLRGREIAYGDLQHGNVLATQKGLRLVDYDGMYVPALARMGTSEIGHENYQHPGRQANDYGPAIDNFAALAIYVALLALVEEPNLWAAFDTGDNLLWRKVDFQDSATSPLFSRLVLSQDQHLATLAKTSGLPARVPSRTFLRSRPQAAD